MHHPKHHPLTGPLPATTTNDATFASSLPFGDLKPKEFDTQIVSLPNLHQGALMADEGDDCSDKWRTRAIMATKSKHVIRWEEDSDKLWTTKHFNSKAFINTITKIWNLSKGVKAQEINTNLFLFQFFHWKDHDRVIEGELWFFNRNVVVLKAAMAGAQPSKLVPMLTHSRLWVRIYDYPLGWNKERKLRSIADTIGTFLKVDKACTKGWTRSLRVKVLMDLWSLSLMMLHSSEIMVKRLSSLSNMSVYLKFVTIVDRWGMWIMIASSKRMMRVK
ncbi:hypothetical protein Cgig2_001089 [Carnegiea gigantea]|uniref:DUF4283 domain-containing protein n=1 Tax=Carnegiea gigantea TaxID=171969 RepID=A0A9Q1JVI1_9CARY|nr:hypothetical protein Cgig2_001089 [Carnegiea gigantea]